MSHVHALVPTLLVGLLSAAPAVGIDDDDSLEAFLRRARAETARVQAAWADQVNGIVEELEHLPMRARLRDAEQRRDMLVDMGPEVAPLLVAHLEPGPAPSKSALFRAEQVVLVLRELASPAITGELVERAQTGSMQGRLNALEVLETSTDSARVAPAVREIYRSAEGTLRERALLSLARLGGPEAAALLADALDDDDPAVVDVAIRSLAQVDNESVANQILALAKDGRGAEHVYALVDFYFVRRSLLEDQTHVIALAELAAGPIQREAAVRLLSAMADLDVDPKTPAKRVIDPLTKNVNDEIREAALVLLARAGDKGARKNLLKGYNDRINRQRDYDKVYISRADILYRIADYADAIRDYREAKKLQDRRSQSAEPYIGMARCYARQKRYKDAAEHLDDAPVSTTTLHELSQDPAFAGMLETKWVSAFRLPK